jgi:hypothetical protein
MSEVNVMWPAVLRRAVHVLCCHMLCCRVLCHAVSCYVQDTGLMVQLEHVEAVSSGPTCCVVLSYDVHVM